MRQNRNKYSLFILLLGLMLFSTEKSDAQTILLDPPQSYIGVSGGINGSMYNLNPMTAEQSYSLGYGGGLAFRFVTERGRGLQIEANYTERGINNINPLFQANYKYLEVPLLSHIYWGDLNRFALNVGPSFGYMLEEEIIADDKTTSSDGKPIFTPVNSKFDYGIAAGFAYNFHTKRAGVYQFELRGYFSLSDLLPNKKVDYFQTSNTIMVSAKLGYFIQLTGKEKKYVISSENEEFLPEKEVKEEVEEAEAEEKLSKKEKRAARRMEKAEKRAAKKSKKDKEKE